jgi:hypothetical protein
MRIMVCNQNHLISSSPIDTLLYITSCLKVRGVKRFEQVHHAVLHCIYGVTVTRLRRFRRFHQPVLQYIPCSVVT